jgi:hypothetical protein
MERLLNISRWAIGLWVATIIASITITAHVRRFDPSVRNSPATIDLSHGESSAASENGVIERAANAAYRDGLFEGKLARSRGSLAHVSVGRWTKQNDRRAFAAGYQAGFGTLRPNTRLQPAV